MQRWRSAHYWKWKLSDYYIIYSIRERPFQQNCISQTGCTPLNCNPLSSPNCNCILTELAVESKVETHQWLFHWNPSVNNTSYLPFNFALLFFLQDTGFYIFIGNVTLQTFLSKIFILLHIFKKMWPLCVLCSLTIIRWIPVLYLFGRRPSSHLFHWLWK